MNQQIPSQSHTKRVLSFTTFDTQIKIRSDFDTGNLHSAKQILDGSYLITPAYDSYKSEVTMKTFFHFKVENYPQQQITIRIQPIALLIPLQKSGNLEDYRPWIKYTEDQYQKLEEAEVRVYGDDNLCLALKFTPKYRNFYLSFAEPYSYEKYIKLINSLKEETNIYLRKQVLCYSLQKRPIHLLTITSNDAIDQIEQHPKVENSILFPDRTPDDNILQFKKQVVMITARVHPGQSSSSFAMEGIIKFLLSNDLRAQILRKLFQFVLIPMLNPDGVYNGFYRTDTMAHNLNRFYVNADQKQPSIFCVKTLIEMYSLKQKLAFFFDLHGHPSYKGSFLYGNFIDDLSLQNQAYLLAKVISMNCPTFLLSNCNFTKNQMSAKDRPSQPSKQGSGRVFTFRTANIPHSYTFQLGMHGTKDINQINQTTNANFTVNQYSHSYTPYLLLGQKAEYNRTILGDEGISILISILDLFQMNPFSRINRGLNNVSELRRISMKDVYQKTDRFRLLQKLTPTKILCICKQIQQSLTKSINVKWMNNFYWPQCMKLRRTLRLNSSVSNPITFRPEALSTFQMQTLQTQQYRFTQNSQSKHLETERKKDILMTSFQRLSNSNTISVDHSTARVTYQYSSKQKMQAYISESKQIQSKFIPFQKSKHRYKRLFILQKDYLAQKREQVRKIQINFQELRLQPQNQQRSRQKRASTKLINRQSTKQSQRIRMKVVTKNQPKTGNDTAYQSIFVQKQKQSVKRNPEFKLASLLHPTQQKRSEPYSDQKMRLPNMKDIKLQKFVKSFKQKRRSNV